MAKKEKGKNPFTKEQRLKALRTQLANLEGGAAPPGAIEKMGGMDPDVERRAHEVLGRFKGREEAF